MSARRTCSLAVLACAGMLALSGCGGTPHPGAAAVVGGHRITVAAVQSQAGQLRGAVGADAKTVNLPRFTLNRMINDRVLDRAATAQGITVQASDWRRLEAADEKTVGGRAALEQTLLQHEGLLPGQIDDFYRQQAEWQQLQASTGQPAGSKAAATAGRKILADTAAGLHIDINPRYGSWDVAKMQLGKASEPWLKQA
ncbi:hypothetical protein BIV57_03715 [Mangrovactinospora gilvigrisea]|uniref:SurA N-terminal domain-containing protein n=1 Tax=Mangrovactinospora gilvigrisea TaxID=1428644 RepID=A0A1J7BJN2_9ACTN|nr:SurA N-terminal domain-containing protein [Mangrovactinospora gilvigrisea]OIV38854.1 hypothetical protein BIV57_03715 [Mangrovactinospora gilvigrisea]